MSAWNVQLTPDTMSANSCASFVQLRAGPAIIERVVEVDAECLTEGVGFVQKYDGFIMDEDRPR